MRVSKVIIVIGSLCILALAVNYLIKVTKSNVNSIDLYEKPIVSLVTIDRNGVRIEAGIYAYGDINQDGVIDERDVQFMKSLLEAKLSFTDSQKKLADINHDGDVDQNDLNSLEERLASSKEIKYDTNSKELEYGVSPNDDVANCQWQTTNMFVIEQGREYYAFARIKNGDNISLSYKFNYEVVEEEE